MNRQERRRLESIGQKTGKPAGLTGVLICLPVFGQFNMTRTTQTIFEIGQWLTLNSIPNQLLWYSASDIVEVRNLFLTAWYDGYPQHSHMLFMDSDMGFDAHVVRDMLKFGKPLTGLLYRRRQDEVSVVGTAYKTPHTIDDVVDGFLRSSGIGGGGMLIARTLVDEMLRQMPELRDELPSTLAEAAPKEVSRLIRAFDPIRTGNRRLSEDMSFCQRWMDCGGEIWANVRYPISHIGPHDYQLCYELELKRNAFKKQLFESCPKIEGESEEAYGARLAACWEEMKKSHREAA